MTHVVIQSSMKTNTFFVALEHCCIRAMYEDLKPDDYIPCSIQIPHNATPRPALPNGVVASSDDVIAVYYSEMARIDMCSTCPHQQLCSPGKENWEARIDWIRKQGYLPTRIPDDAAKSNYTDYMQKKHQITPDTIAAITVADEQLVTGAIAVAAQGLATQIFEAKMAKNGTMKLIFERRLGQHVVRYYTEWKFLLDGCWYYFLLKSVGYNGKFDTPNYFGPTSRDRRRIKNLMHRNIRALRRSSNY